MQARVLVAVVLLLSVMMSSAQPRDQIVSKDFPANITCRRNSTQRDVERQRITAMGENQFLLVLHY